MAKTILEEFCLFFIFILKCHALYNKSKFESKLNYKKFFLRLTINTIVN